MKVTQKQEQRPRRRLSWLRLIILAIAILFIVYGAFTAIRSIPGNTSGLWASIFSLIVGAASLIVGLIPLLPLTGKSKRPTRADWPTLVIYATESRLGQDVKVLLSDIWYHYPLSRSRHPNVEVRYIELFTMNKRQFYGAVFKDLIPDMQYMLWTKDCEPMPITLAPGQVKEIRLIDEQEA